MFAHRTVRLESSPGLSGAVENGLSPSPNNALLAGSVCAVTAQARRPGVRLLGVKVTLAALQVWPVNGVPCVFVPPPGIVASNLTVMLLGTTPVSVFFTMSDAFRCCAAFGLTKHEQHATSCSSGEKA